MLLEAIAVETGVHTHAEPRLQLVYKVMRKVSLQVYALETGSRDRAAVNTGAKRRFFSSPVSYETTLSRQFKVSVG